MDRPSPATKALLDFSVALIFILTFSEVDGSGIGSSNWTGVCFFVDIFLR